MLEIDKFDGNPEHPEGKTYLGNACYRRKPDQNIRQVVEYTEESLAAAAKRYLDEHGNDSSDPNVRSCEGVLQQLDLPDKPRSQSGMISENSLREASGRQDPVRNRSI
jgi:hypothetical protein